MKVSKVSYPMMAYFLSNYGQSVLLSEELEVEKTGSDGQLDALCAVIHEIAAYFYR